MRDLSYRATPKHTIEELAVALAFNVLNEGITEVIIDYDTGKEVPYSVSQNLSQIENTAVRAVEFNELRYLVTDDMRKLGYNGYGRIQLSRTEGVWVSLMERETLRN